MQVLAYHETWGLPAMITRGSNTFGPYQYPEKVLPLFITNAGRPATAALWRWAERARLALR
jgi:dTDP-glucose 4,6-dehydratase